MSEIWKKATETWNKETQNKSNHWSGSFVDYLDIVKQNPRVAQNSFQRMYQMILSKGTEEYTHFKQEMIRYKFFNDEDNGGKDAVFGLDQSLMTLVNTLKAASLGYGAEKRVILLHGPVGSAKSTICRMLKKGLEAYSQTEEGKLFTFEWHSNGNEKVAKLLGNTEVYPTPMNEEPLLLLPENVLKTVVDEINRGQQGDFRLKITGELSPPSRFIFKNSRIC